MKSNAPPTQVNVTTRYARVVPAEQRSNVSAKPAPVAPIVAVPNSDSAPESSNENEEGNCNFIYG